MKFLPFKLPNITDYFAPNGKWYHIDKTVQLKSAEKKNSEMLEHFSKKVPEESHVWSQLWKQKQIILRKKD